ncbi:MAG: hypothetical protein QXS20_09990 [Candidatus Thorarchaeota archaeon]
MAPETVKRHAGSNCWLEDNERELIDLFREIEREGRVIIVVEGARDEMALRELGVTLPVVRVHRGQSREQVLELIVGTLIGRDMDVLILTDFDPEGTELNRYLEHELELRRIHVQKNQRAHIGRLMRGLRHVEQLISLLKKRDSPTARCPPDQ